MSLETIWFDSMEAHVAAIDTFHLAEAALDEAAAAHRAAQAALPKGHPDRVATFAALIAARTRREAACAAIWEAERTANVAGQALRDEGDFYAAAAVYAREYQLPRAFAAAEKAASTEGMDWLAASDRVEKAAKTASLWRELPALWEAAAPASAARWVEGERMNRAHQAAEWERNQPTTSSVGWLRG